VALTMTSMPKLSHEAGSKGHKLGLLALATGTGTGTHLKPGSGHNRGIHALAIDLRLGPVALTVASMLSLLS
jgi:hypothetical protein